MFGTFSDPTVACFLLLRKTCTDTYALYSLSFLFLYIYIFFLHYVLKQIKHAFHVIDKIYQKKNWINSVRNVRGICLLLSLSLKDSAIDVEDTMHLSPSDFQLQGSFLEAEAETSKPPRKWSRTYMEVKFFCENQPFLAFLDGTNMNWTPIFAAKVTHLLKATCIWRELGASKQKNLVVLRLSGVMKPIMQNWFCMVEFWELYLRATKTS